MHSDRRPLQESESDWRRGQRSSAAGRQGQHRERDLRSFAPVAAMGSDRCGGYPQSTGSGHHPHHHQPHYYPQSVHYSYSPSHNPHTASWSSADVHRQLSFAPPQTFPTNPMTSPHHHHSATHSQQSQYMDMFAPANSYGYSSYSGNFFNPHPHLTGAGGDNQFWGQQRKHPVIGSSSGYDSNVPFFGQRMDYRVNENAESMAAVSGAMESLSIQGHGNGYSVPNSVPSSGSENSNFSSDAGSQAPMCQQKQSSCNSYIQREERRRTNQSWASVASQTARTGHRGRHNNSQSSRVVVPAHPSLTDADSAGHGVAATEVPASLTISSTTGTDTERRKKSQIPAEKEILSWVQLNDEPLPSLCSDILDSDNGHYHSATSTVSKVSSDPSAQSRETAGNSESNNALTACRDQRPIHETQPSLVPEKDIVSVDRRLTVSRNSSVTGLAVSQPLKPVIDPKTLKDKVQLDNIFNPKDFDLKQANARFFVIKSYSEDDIHRSIKYSIWCSTERGNKRLDEAFSQSNSSGGVVYLFFSVNGSGHFCGMAQMLSALDYNSSANVWAQNKWKGQFKVRWIYVKDVPNAQLRHIRLENNENKPVTNSRDTQEVMPDKGREVLSVLHSYRHSTSIFDDFLHYEKRQEEESHRRVDAGNRSRERHEPELAVRDRPTDRDDCRRRHRPEESRDHANTGRWERESATNQDHNVHDPHGNGTRRHHRRREEDDVPFAHRSYDRRNTFDERHHSQRTN